jgi:hypothetical protein
LLAAAVRAWARRLGFTWAAWCVVGVGAVVVGAGLLLAASEGIGAPDAPEPDLGAVVLIAWSVTFSFASATYLGSGPRSGEEGQRWRALPAPGRSRWAAAIAPSAITLLVGGAVAGPASACVVSTVAGVGFSRAALLGLLSALLGSSVGLVVDASVFLTHRGRVGLLVHRVGVGAGLVGVAAGTTLALRSDTYLPHPAWQLRSGGSWTSFLLPALGAVLLTAAGVAGGRAAFVVPPVRHQGAPLLTRWIAGAPGWSMPAAARLLRNRLVTPYVAYLLLAGSAVGLAVALGAWQVRALALDLWALVLPLGGLALQLAVGAAGRVPYETRQLGVPRARVVLRTGAAASVVVGAGCAPGLVLTSTAEPLAATAACGLLAAHLCTALAVGLVLCPAPDRSSEVLLALAAQAGLPVLGAAMWSRAFPSTVAVAWAVAATGLVPLALLIWRDGVGTRQGRRAGARGWSDEGRRR